MEGGWNVGGISFWLSSVLGDGVWMSSRLWILNSRVTYYPIFLCFVVGAVIIHPDSIPGCPCRCHLAREAGVSINDSYSHPPARLPRSFNGKGSICPSAQANRRVPCGEARQSLWQLSARVRLCVEGALYLHHPVKVGSMPSDRQATSSSGGWLTADRIRSRPTHTFFLLPLGATLPASNLPRYLRD